MTRFWLRLFRSDPWVPITLAILTLLVTTVATAVPRTMGSAADRQLRQSIDTLPSAQRDPFAVWQQIGTVGGPVDPGGAGPMARLTEEGATAHAALPAPLRDVLSPPEFLAVDRSEFPFVPSFVPEKSTGLFEVGVQGAINPTLTDAVRLVDGTWPQPSAATPLEVVLDKGVAERIGATTGDVLADTFTVTGLVEPVDVDDDRWQAHDLGTAVTYVNDPNKGTAAVVRAYLAPTSSPEIADADDVHTFEMRVWFPSSGARLPDGTAPGDLAEQLTQFLSTSQDIQSPIGPLTLASGLGAALDQSQRQQVSAQSLIGTILAGPLGVAFALVWLGAEFVVLRRQDHLTLATARGASRRQLRAHIGLEAALLTVPAAVAGHLLGTLAPGSSPWWQWVFTAVVGVLPAAALMAAVERHSPRTRRDLDRRPGKARLAAEIGLAAVAAAAVWQLLRSPGDGSSVDLLAVATPILLAGIAALLAMRLLPVLLAMLLRWFRRGRGLIGLLGTARALRDPAGGLVPTLAVVLGTTIAVLSTVLLGTIVQGAEDAAWDAAGADVKVNGHIAKEALASMRALDGVTSAGTVGTVSESRTLIADGVETPVDVWVVEDELEQVWQDTPFAGSIPAGLFADGAIVVGGDVDAPGAATIRGVGDVTVAGHLERLPGVLTKPRFVVVSASTWESLGQLPPSPSRAFLSVDGDAEQVVRQATALLDHATATTVDTALRRNADNLVTKALRTTAVGAAVVAVTLTALALLTVVLMGARKRASLLAVLRTQGLRPRQGMGVVAWEVGPLAALALFVGVVAGIGISWLLVHAVDLTGFTGGDEPPALHLDPLALTAVTLTVLGTIGVTVAVTAWLAARTNLAQALRIGEER